MNKKFQNFCLMSFAFFCLANTVQGTLPSSKINGKYYLSQSPWSGSITTAIDDVNALNAQITLVIDCDTNLSYSRTVNKEVVLEFVSGTKITIPDTRTLTVNGPVIAGLYQIFVDNTTGKNGVQGDAQIEDVLPEWWGAVRNTVTDSSAAIIKAVIFAQAGSTSGRKSVVFADGSYYVNSPVPLVGGKPITIKGTGYYNTRIIANATMTSIFQMTDSSTYERYSFMDIAINGAYKANYGIYADSGVVSGLRCTRIMIFGALQAGLSIGSGWCNNFIDCEILNNGNSSHLANGLEFRIAGPHNGINIIACKIVNNTGVGILVNGGCTFNVSECVIESNDGCGIGVSYSKNVNIVNNYFELNGNVGLTVTTPSVLVQSHIFLNGGTSWNTLGNAYPVTGVTISSNYFTNDGYAAPNCFIYAASLFNGKIESNSKPSTDNCQELFAKREWPTYSYRNVSLNGQTFYYAPSVVENSSVQIESLSYLSACYPATVKIIATSNGAASDMSFDVNVLIKDDQTIGGYNFSNQINTTMSTAPTISNANLTLNNLPAGDWTFVYTVSSIKIN